MAALRTLVLLLAVAASVAYAGKISGSVRATGVQHAVNVATKHIDTQIAEIEKYGVITDVIDNALDKLKELVGKIQEKVEHAEKDLIKAIKKAAELLAKNLNAVIKKASGLDLDLDDKLEDFENKAQDCAESLKAKVRATLLGIKSDAETCAAPQIEEAKKLTQQIRNLIEIVESVPSETIKNIKECVHPTPITTPAPEPETTIAPEPETTLAPEPETTLAPEPETTLAPEPETTLAPEPETTLAPEPETTLAPEPETTLAPEPETTVPAEDNENAPVAQSDSVVVVNFNKRSVRGISDIFEKVKCVAEALTKAASDLKDVPKTVYYLDKEIRDLASKDTQKKLKNCAAKAIAGKGKELQKDAAELAYCIIAPSDD